MGWWPGLTGLDMQINSNGIPGGLYADNLHYVRLRFANLDLGKSLAVRHAPRNPAAAGRTVSPSGGVSMLPAETSAAQLGRSSPSTVHCSESHHVAKAPRKEDLAGLSPQLLTCAQCFPSASSETDLTHV